MNETPQQGGGVLSLSVIFKNKEECVVAIYKEINCSMQWRGGRGEEPQAEEEPAIDLEEREQQEPNTEWEE